MSIASYNYGLTCAGFVTMGPSLFGSCGNILALSAEIDTSLLKWVNLTALQAEYPKNVSLIGSTVHLTGPVAVIQSVTTFKIMAMALPAIITGIFTYFISKKVLKALEIKEEQISTYSKGLALAAFIGVAFLVGLKVNNLVSEPGIYFLWA